MSARKVAFKNDTQKPNTDTPAINLIEMNTRVRPLLNIYPYFQFDEILNLYTSILFQRLSFRSTFKLYNESLKKDLF